MKKGTPYTTHTSVGGALLGCIVLLAVDFPNMLVVQFLVAVSGASEDFFYGYVCFQTACALFYIISIDKDVSLLLYYHVYVLYG